MSLSERLQALLDQGTDNARLRFGLASSLASEGLLEAALVHAKMAVQMDPDYSAAWRLLGQLSVRLDRLDEAERAFNEGIQIAERKGDRQLIKEMQVFLRRLQKNV